MSEDPRQPRRRAQRPPSGGQGFWQGSADNPYADFSGDALADEGGAPGRARDGRGRGSRGRAGRAPRPERGRPDPSASAPSEGEVTRLAAAERTRQVPVGRPLTQSAFRRGTDGGDGAGDALESTRRAPVGRADGDGPSETRIAAGYPAGGANDRAPRNRRVPIAPPLPPRPTIRGSGTAGTDRLARAEAARRALDAQTYFTNEGDQPYGSSRRARRPPAGFRGIPPSRLHFWRWFRTLPIFAMVLMGVASLVVSLGLFGINKWLYPVEYNDLIVQAAQERGIDPMLVASVIRTESGWDPEAVSRVGAVGLMQLLPETASDLAARGVVDPSVYDPANLEDPATNIAYGTAYLSDCLASTESLDQAIAAYNAGISAAQAWAASGTPFEEAIQYPETTAYLERVRQALERYTETYPDGIPQTG